MYVHVSLSGSVHVSAVPKVPGAQVTGSCEAPNVGVGNGTLFLCEDCMCF